MPRKKENGKEAEEQLIQQLQNMKDSLDEEMQEIENPYTVTNRGLTELVRPRDTMLYLSSGQITTILGEYFFADLPKLVGEEEVPELKEFATKLKYYLVSKGGRGRRDILRLFRVSSGQVRENVNKSMFKQLLQGGKDSDVEED